MSPWSYVLIALAAAMVVLLLLELKTSRPDGILRNVHPYRRIMWFIMPTRNESVVYFDSFVDATELLEYLPQAKEKFGATLTHVIVAAIGLGVAENPTMNRFVAGRRMYDRDGIWVSFSMKRKKMDQKAKLAVVKYRFSEDTTLQSLCTEVSQKIDVHRSGKKTYSDKEISAFARLPRPAFMVMFWAVGWLDHYNLLPGWFIEGDPMYTSVFVSNLGSMKMDAGYHHLYEWGTCPLFLMVGQLHDRPVVKDGKVVSQPSIHIRVSYDERTDDGLSAGRGIESVIRVLEHPFAELGCLAADGSDQKLLIAGAPA